MNRTNIAVSIAAIAIAISLTACGGNGGGASTDYINGYQDGYYNWGSTQWAGMGDNPCDGALAMTVANGGLLDGNDPNDNGSADYNSGWSAGCDDGANQRASKYPQG